jgi:hypothetical protein
VLDAPCSADFPESAGAVTYFLLTNNCSHANESLRLGFGGDR